MMHGNWRRAREGVTPFASHSLVINSNTPQEVIASDWGRVRFISFNEPVAVRYEIRDRHQ